MKTSKIAIVTLLFIGLSGCADTVTNVYQYTDVGFFHGLWHGMIMPFAFIVSLFNDGVAIYAANNSGSWYDFGFIVGVNVLWTIEFRKG